jgi:hypothetical protein
MRKVLIYIEPHPVRNYYEEFYDVGSLLCESMHRLNVDSGYEFRFLSNDIIIDRMITEKAHLSYLSMRFTAQESGRLDSMFGQWGTKTIEDWLSLVRGEGTISEFYVDVLSRVREEYYFDAIILWSDNGAVRNFCHEQNIVVMHAELGPTRSPFPQTIYFDPLGTNGAASVLSAPLDVVESEVLLPRETWVTQHGKSWNDENKVGLIDAGLTLEISDNFSTDLHTPYIFVPLQLADDLNTQLYSELKSPLQFLAHLIPQAIALGLKVLIKGHPAAPGRPFNLIAETKALNMAASFGDQVVILPRGISALASLKIMSQAVATCTINSSVGFENILIGKKTILFGKAAFDIGDDMNIRLANLTEEHLFSNTDAKLDRLTSFLMNHYLHPIESVTNGIAIKVLLDLLFRHKGKSKDSVEFWTDWVNSIKFGYHWISHNESSWQNRPVPSNTGIFAGNRRMFEASSKSIESDNGNYLITGNNRGSYISASVVHDDNAFIGFIDSLVKTTEGDGLQIAGWCVERDKYRPPIQVLFCVAEKIISSHRLLTVRRDVAEVLSHSITPRCGFTFDINEKHLEDINLCALVFVSSDNRAQMIKLKVGSIH